MLRLRYTFRSTLQRAKPHILDTKVVHLRITIQPVDRYGLTSARGHPLRIGFKSCIRKAREIFCLQRNIFGARQICNQSSPAIVDHHFTLLAGIPRYSTGALKTRDDPSLQRGFQTRMSTIRTPAVSRDALCRIRVLLSSLRTWVS